MDKIYQLHIITTEDTKVITDKIVFRKECYGYYTCIENVTSAICEFVVDLEKDFEEYPEYIQTIYCDEIELDVDFSDGYVLFFNEEGDLLKRTIYDSVAPKIPKFKLGDYVTIFDKHGYKIKIGVITQLPDEEDIYTVYYTDSQDEGEYKYYDHIHTSEDWLYKVENVSGELKIKLENILKTCITKTEYNRIRREEKLNNILK